MDDHEQAKIDRDVERRCSRVEQQGSGQAETGKEAAEKKQPLAEEGQFPPHGSGQQQPLVPPFLPILQSPYRQPFPHQDAGRNIVDLAQFRLDLGQVDDPVAFGQGLLPVFALHLLVKLGKKVEIDQVSDGPQIFHGWNSRDEGASEGRK